MSILQELLNRRAELDREIEETRRNEKAEAIAKVRALMAEHDLTLADLSTRTTVKTPAAASKTKVAVKYRNEATGDSWTGRGLQPKWLRAALASGRSLEEFTV